MATLAVNNCVVLRSTCAGDVDTLRGDPQHLVFKCHSLSKLGLLS